MLLKKIKYYYFINNFNLLELKKINNYKNLFLIYYDTKQSNIEDVYKIKNFAKKNKIKLYISNYNHKFSNIKIDGIHIPSSNKKRILIMMCYYTIFDIMIARKSLCLCDRWRLGRW